ncbi:hypothetical protein ACTXJX_14910 [Glutamicibacter ardleyensis]|uniref:hypothetical protein n=1 Tax=Glutamicibacter ardleyensis TaxID=225894 RepID=UPI003FD5924F
MSLTVSIPVSGNLTNITGLQLRKNNQKKSVLYFKLAVVEDGRNGGQSKTHFLPCTVNGAMADNLYYAIQNELITTRTRLNAVLGLDTYSKPFTDASNGKQVDVQQSSYPVWEIGVSARFAPMADVNSPGFQRLMNGQQNQPQQGGGFQQNQPQQGGYGNQNQQGGGYQQNQPQQGGYGNQNQQGGGYQQNQPQHGGYGNQNQQESYPQDQQGNQPQQANTQPGHNVNAQEQTPQQAEQSEAPQQNQTMRDQPLLDGDDF